ncbi:hypothetical protein Sme01_48320 [Sphaerisporangium melleum]|uniref:DUF2231 domain-containing protein n=1 Tax=Sphaerisporangium melleum TaxID=321316 RepID=A0A917VJL1_9ACTN|nr:DUF2231 domain-containing protein [Sphaerisporangium melleum]GGK87091.1 hypothetical protein GCM10007964_31990 [Sphaerisporangium melleum]GII72356.1 hypothetical protein Sme01_48320 [Sphaerisporangium melleum]
MFDQIFGLPAHPLMIHAAVVFIPLLAVGSIAYGVVPRVRPRIAWAVVLLAIAAPAAAFAAKESGEAFFEAMFGGGLPEGPLAARVQEHEGYANPLVLSTFGLAVSSLLLVYSSRRWGRVTTAVLAVLTVLLALTAAFYVLRAGHTGATAVWAR